MKVFNTELAEFRRVVLGTSDYFNQLKERVKYIKKGLTNGSVDALELLTDLTNFEKKKTEIDFKLYGDESLARREFETLPGFIGSLENIVGSSWGQSYGATGTHLEKYAVLKNEFKTLYASIVELKNLVESIESKAEKLKMPATYGRLPLLEK